MDNIIKAMFEKPLTKINFPKHEEKRLPLYTNEAHLKSEKQFSEFIKKRERTIKQMISSQSSDTKTNPTSAAKKESQSRGVDTLTKQNPEKYESVMNDGTRFSKTEIPRNKGNQTLNRVGASSKTVHNEIPPHGPNQRKHIPSAESGVVDADFVKRKTVNQHKRPIKIDPTHRFNDISLDKQTKEQHNALLEGIFKDMKVTEVVGCGLGNTHLVDHRSSFGNDKTLVSNQDCFQPVSTFSVGTRNKEKNGNYSVSDHLVEQCDSLTSNKIKNFVQDPQPKSVFKPKPVSKESNSVSKERKPVSKEWKPLSKESKPSSKESKPSSKELKLHQLVTDQRLVSKGSSQPKLVSKESKTLSKEPKLIQPMTDKKVVSSLYEVHPSEEDSPKFSNSDNVITTKENDIKSMKINTTANVPSTNGVRYSNTKTSPGNGKESSLRRSKRRHSHQGEEEIPNSTNQRFPNSELPPEKVPRRGLTLKEQEQITHVTRKKRFEKRNEIKYQRHLEEEQRRTFEKSKPCKYYLKYGRCNYNDECRNSHDIDARKKDGCKFYIQGSCLKGDACLFMHEDWPCRFFHLKGFCNNKDKCRFSHAELSDEMREVLLAVREQTEDANSVEGTTKEPNTNQKLTYQQNNIHTNDANDTEAPPTSAANTADDEVTKSDSTQRDKDNNKMTPAEDSSTNVETKTVDLFPSLYSDLS